MHVFSFGDSSLNVPAIVGEMDQVTWALKSAYERARGFSPPLMWSSEQVNAVSMRLNAIAGLIRELDVGGAGREHVFFPLPGQTSDEAWSTYKRIAEETKASLAQLGQFVSKWSLMPTLARIGGDVASEFKTDTTLIIVGIGALLLLNVLGQVGQARRAFTGHRRQRR